VIPRKCIEPVFLLQKAEPLAADLADGRARSVDDAESLLAEFRRHAGPVAELPPATGSTVLLRYLSVRPGKVLEPHGVWRDPQIYSYTIYWSGGDFVRGLLRVLIHWPSAALYSAASRMGRRR
jgi:hypothetical protein